MAASNFPNRPFRLEESVWLHSQSVAGNYSVLRCQLWIRKNSYSPTFSGSASSFTFWINGTQVAGNNFTYDFRNSNEMLLAQVDVTVPHNADGSKPSVAIDAYCSAQILGYTEVHSAMGLPTIPRASTAQYAGGSTFDCGSPVTINIQRASASFTHDLYWYFGTEGPVHIASGVQTTTTWTPPLSMLQQIPATTTGTGMVRVFTLSGGSILGMTDVPFTLRAPASVVPEVTTLAVADLNPDVASIVGKFVQGLSRAKLTVTGDGVYGSTITSAQATLLGTTVASGGSVAVTQAGTLAVTGKVTDSRGRVGTAAGTIAALAYSPPRASAYQARRCSSIGAVQDDGAYLRVDLTAAISSLINGAEKNALTIRAFTRPRGTGPWTARNVIAPGGVAYGSWFLVSGGGIFTTTSSWDVRVQVEDKFGAYVADTTVSTIQVALDLNGKNVGVGKIHEQGVLDVGGDIYQSGQVVIDASDVATATVRGIVELATPAEAIAGTDAVRAVTPAGLKAAMSSTDTAWAVLPLASNWGAYAAEVAYWRIKDGICFLTGRVTGQAAAGTTIGTLPAAARPTSQPLSPVWNTHSDNGSTVMLIGANGDVVIASRSGQLRQGVSLAGISFPVG